MGNHRSVAVIDYCMGNLHSVAKALGRVGAGMNGGVEVIVSGEPEVILAADRVVLPGVGAIRDCVGEIRRLGLDEVIKEAVVSKPLLGVCVGMQVLMKHSEENDGVDCLGILPGEVRSFTHMPPMVSGAMIKIPHMGWNQVHQAIEHPLWEGISQDARFYFVHSYFVEPADPALIAASTSYPLPFTSAVARDNVFATQFHPEKSQHAGLQLYANFLRWSV